MMDRRSSKCKECTYQHMTDIYNILSRDKLKDLIRNYTFVEIGKMYNVSDKAVTKWCNKYNLPHRKTDIQKISDEDWEFI